MIRTTQDAEVTQKSRADDKDYDPTFEGGHALGIVFGIQGNEI